MKLPVCIGMPRSASRMTWQIVKQIAPDEPPEGYFPELVKQFVQGEKVWPIRGHDYLPEAPIVYTFRNPVEAYLSLRSRFRTDLGKMVPAASNKTKIVMGQEVIILDPEVTTEMTPEQADYDAMVSIGNQWEVWKRLKADQTAGRDVLFLRYEEYFENRMARIEAISDFMEINLEEAVKADIFEYTSIENNTTRSLDPKFTENEKVTFSHGYLGKSGMQKGHINLQTKGVPGAYLEAHPKFVNSVRVGLVPAFQALKEMTNDMGYMI